MKDIKLVATDLDGTFLKDDKSISEKDLKALDLLGERGVVRVAATGRNLSKVKQVINGHVPFDYIVFSSGAGVFDWRRKELMHDQNISARTSKRLITHFIQTRINFHVFYPVPENHKHWYYRGDKHCEEFERYFDYNRANAFEMTKYSWPEQEACQFLIIIPEDEKRFQELKNEIEALDSEIRVIRASSPITKGYIWIEVFHNSVSKGNGIKVICDHNGIPYQSTLGLGNDYNDIDMLDFTGHSFLTQNAPLEIRSLYQNAPSNEEDAFSFVTELLIDKQS